MIWAFAILATLLASSAQAASPVPPRAAITTPTAAPAMQDRSFITSDGVRLHYTEAGRGFRTLVFVPGWTMPAWIWNRQVEAFARNYHVIAFDPRGQGASDIARSGYDHVRRGEDIAELLATIGPEPVVLVGWSLGVLDTLAYIQAQGDRHVAALVLVDNSIGENPPPVAFAPPPRNHGKPLPRPEVMRRFVHTMFAQPQPAPWLNRLTAAALRVPEWAAKALLAYPVPRTYWREAVYSTTRPILYVVRQHLAGQAENLAANHRGAETAVWRDVGHALFVDDPPRFNALLRDFIVRRVWP
jgi:non-heme chloroperoxidase